MPNRKKSSHRVSGPHAPAPVHPGEVLQRDFIEKHHITQVELARLLGISFPRLNLILHGKRSITPDTALRLERIFGKPAERPRRYHVHVVEAGSDEEHRMLAVRDYLRTHEDECAPQ